MLLVGTGRLRRRPVRFGSAGLPQRSGGHQYFGLIEGTRCDQQDGLPIKQSDDLTSKHGSAQTMKHRMTRAWKLALTIAPLAAIALVEAAMKRW